MLWILLFFKHPIQRHIQLYNREIKDILINYCDFKSNKLDIKIILLQIYREREIINTKQNNTAWVKNIKTDFWIVVVFLISI